MALDQQKLINASSANKQKRYTCPICHEVVIFKNGPKIIMHFAHFAASNCVNSKGETQNHLRGKQQLFHDLIGQYPLIELEVYLEDIKQRPDLLADKLAFEYQCSPITNQRLQERVSGYNSQKIKSIWILGMNYFKQNLHAHSVLRFLRYQKNVGFYLLFLDSVQHCYYLKYRIVQINHQLVWKLKKFSNYQSLVYFMNQLQFINYSQTNLITLTQMIENKIQRQDKTLLQLQKICYENRHLLTGCPIIVYYPQPMIPILNRNWLEWKIKIILYLEKKQHCHIKELKQLVKYDEFPFLKISNPVRLFLQILEKCHFVKIEGPMIFLLQEFIWYRDTYDKIDAIKKMRKRHNNDI